MNYPITLTISMSDFTKNWHSKGNTVAQRDSSDRLWFIIKRDDTHLTLIPWEYSCETQYMI